MLRLLNFLITKQDFLILGYFNSDLAYVSEYGLTQHVLQPTHICGNTLNLLITPSRSPLVPDVSVIDGVSDHFAVLF